MTFLTVVLFFLFTLTLGHASTLRKKYNTGNVRATDGRVNVHIISHTHDDVRTLFAPPLLAQHPLLLILSPSYLLCPFFYYEPNQYVVQVGWLKTVDQYYYGANNSIQHANVNSIISAHVLALAENMDRKFSYVEQAFFQRWWSEQDTDKQNLVRGLVDRGQLEFINGGWR